MVAFSAQPLAAQLAVLIVAGIVTADAVRRFIWNHTTRKCHPLPPGPTPLPLLGSALSVNAGEPWLTYTAWRAKYGDVMYVRLFDTETIVLNSIAVASELLGNRSQIYSDRPSIPTIEPYGHDCCLGFTKYGPEWRLRRRIIHQSFRAEAALAFRPMQLHRARQLAINIIDDPDEYPFHFSTFAAAVSMSAVYDYEPLPREDPMVTIIEEFIKASFPALVSYKAVLLNFFPFLLSVPEWIPALSWIRREAKKAYALRNKMVETPYKWVKKRMQAEEDVASDTMVFNHIHRMEKLSGLQRAEYETSLKLAGATAFLGATETTSSTLMSFTLAMVKNPRVWKHAQAEIDEVVGMNRLPDYEDRPSLRYVDAIVRETLRWIPVTPLGIPHAVSNNDIYEGHYIPSGATVVANIWAISRDETRYPDPEAFIPERFLNSEGGLKEDNPGDFVFGFGRRICPGRYAADASVWISVATMLATLDFNAVKDADGNDLKFEAKFTNGISLHPIFFPCNLTPRAHITRDVLQSYLGTCK